MIDVYRVAGSNRDYIAADEGLGQNDFGEAATKEERFESWVKGYEVEDLVPEENAVHVLEKGDEELKWGKTKEGYLADALEDPAGE
ncbi:MAG: hypothetical protein ABEJ07_02010 [Candidatus Nanohaloarchaea archaeon]